MTEDIIGHIVEGEIVNITNFGAFVSIEGKEEGLVHISEIANEFITDINDFVKVGQKIKVKILARNKRNKLELSIKQVQDEGTTTVTIKKDPQATEKILAKKNDKTNKFEDKLSTFIKRSEERQIDIRRNLKNKQGITKKNRK